MLTGKDVKGVIPAIVTPFREDETLDLVGLRTLTRFLLESGVHAIMTTGGNGEFCHLLREEKREVIQTVADEVGGRVPVIAGTAACSTQESILLTQDAQGAGADAAIVVAPYYFGLPEEALYQYFADIAQSVDIPIVVYNNPAYTGNNLTPQLVARLAEVPGIIGLKESNADLGQLVESIRVSPRGFSVCTGIDSQFYPSLCAGDQGVFSTAASAIPGQMVELYEVFLAGEHDRARDLHLRVQSLNRYLEYEPGYVAPCKEVLRLLGMPGGAVRRPLPSLTEEEKAGVRSALEELGLL